MRIQHNIPAMSAYRNYTNNTSAVAKNLEKLSSGYKINRAGDDAAGLAVSEKMRAQITGLEVAQKNAKDGISLVQTAEGALTEVHDMLNRMYELAELASNGTYDDEVDRANYQKEINSLTSEINRIADSVNFNGINLLDGSLSKAGVESVTSSFDLPAVGSELGTNTVLHQGGSSGPTTTALSVDFHNINIEGAGKKFDIKVGDTTLTGTLVADEITGEDIVDALANGTTSKVSFTVGGAAYDSTSVTFGGGEFEADTTSSGTRITFNQKATDTADVTPNMDVTISASNAGSPFTVTQTLGADAGAAPTFSGTLVTSNQANGNGGTTPPTAGKFTVDFSGCSLSGAGTITLTFAGQSVTSNEITAADAATASKLAAAFNGTTITIENQAFNASVTGNTVTFTQANTNTTTLVTGNATATTSAPASAAATKATTAVDFTGKTGADVIGQRITIGDKTYQFVATAGDADVNNVEVVIGATAADSAIATALAGAATGTDVPTGAAAAATGSVVTFTATTAGAAENSKVAPGADNAIVITGDYNKATTNLEKKSEAAADRLASTYFNLNKDMIEQGASIKIGNENYVFKTDKSADPELGANGVKVDISDLDAKADDYLIKVAERLTKAAESNEVYTVGHDKNRITVTETVDHAMLADAANYPDDEFDLRTLEGIANSLGFTSASKAGKALTLQIGDTAESFNKLSVSVNDMHTAAMGIGSINISTQEGASDAMAKIKDAINYVSSTRGDLGATQNRLEHTINNLSVMQENIQDAESTIRDVDIAKEMMAYTKNNILVQSAQAMLAQANQLPQGVLQLLQ